MNRDEKASIVQALGEKFGKAQIAVVANYRGLKVSAMQELRRGLRDKDAEFQVAKNTLLTRAVQGTEFESLSEHFSGTTAIAVSFSDPVGPAKVLTDFAKDHPELEIKSAVLNGKVLSSEDLAALAKLPSKEVLLGQLLGVLNAVPTGLVRVLSGVPRTFLYALQAINDQKGQTEN